MTELDPYQVLGVPRTASRAEIARAYRSLAKQHHPDAGAPAGRAMARLNDAWHILSDDARRARWDRAHSPVIGPPAWVPAPAEPMRRPPAARAEPSVWDSGWVAIALVLGIGLVVGVVMAGISMAANPDERARFEGEEIRFAYPPDWTLAAGTDEGAHRIVAHIVTFPVDTDAELCTSFGAECSMAGQRLPPGEASILITAWSDGTPPVPEPVVSRPFGLDADAVIGGQPAAVEVERDVDGASAWWQLSPPGFPDRWIEVQAEIGGQAIEQEDMLEEISAMLDSVSFVD